MRVWEEGEGGDIFVACMCLHSVWFLQSTASDCSSLSMATLLLALLFPWLAQEAQLSEVNNWDKIEDFNWLSSSAPSPNWDVLLESQRTPVTDTTST